MLQEKCQSPNQTRKAREANTDNNKDGVAYNCLLKNELLGAGIEDLKDHQSDDRRVLTTKEAKNMYQVGGFKCYVIVI